MWGSDWLHTGCQEVGKCSTRGESWGMYITFASAKIVNKAEPTLALKPRGDVTRNPKQGYQWPQNRTCVCVHQKLKKKNNNNKQTKKPWRISSYPALILKKCNNSIFHFQFTMEYDFQRGYAVKDERTFSYVTFSYIEMVEYIQRSIQLANESPAEDKSYRSINRLKFGC